MLTLFDLPPELRNQIWELVLVHDSEIQILNLTTFRSKGKGENDLRALTQVDKILRSETLQIYFGRNTFHCDLGDGSTERFTDLPAKFVGHFCRDSLRSITTLTVCREREHVHGGMRQRECWMVKISGLRFSIWTMVDELDAHIPRQFRRCAYENAMDFVVIFEEHKGLQLQASELEMPVDKCELTWSWLGMEGWTWMH